MKSILCFLATLLIANCVVAQTIDLGKLEKANNGNSFLCQANIFEYNPIATSRQTVSRVDIEVVNKTTGETILSLEDHPQSRFSVQLKDGNEYAIMLHKNGYFVKRMNVKVGMDNCVACFEGLYTLTPVDASEFNVVSKLNIMMRKENIGDRVVLPNIQFDGKTAYLTEATISALDELAMLFRDNNHILGQLEIHTDAKGDADDNFKLSEQRAKAVTQYLTERGVPEDVVYVKGYGEKRIINGCIDGSDCTDAQHAQNRRAIFWLRASIKENNSFNKTLTQVLEEETDLLNEKVEVVARDGKETIAAAPAVAAQQDDVVFPIQRSDEGSNGKDNVVTQMAAGNSNIAANMDNVYPAQRNMNNAATNNKISADDNQTFGVGASSLTNQVNVQSGATNKLCDVDGAKPIRAQMDALDADDNKGIPINRNMQDRVPGSDIISSSVQVDYNSDDEKVVIRRGKATLVSTSYTGYKVELFTTQEELSNDHRIFRNYGKVYFDDTGVAFSYMIGAFVEKDAAEKFLKTVILPRYPDAKVITYKDGKRK